MIIFNKPLGYYEAVDPRWKFKSEGKGLGWNCGAEGHTQVTPEEKEMDQ